MVVCVVIAVELGLFVETLVLVCVAIPVELGLSVETLVLVCVIIPVELGLSVGTSVRGGASVGNIPSLGIGQP